MVIIFSFQGTITAKQWIEISMNKKNHWLRKYSREENIILVQTLHIPYKSTHRQIKRY